MKKGKVELGELLLVGLTARTNNNNEMNPETSKIAGLAGSYWGNQIASNIQHRAKPGVTYAVYTDYERDEHGDYTYFIGEAVTSLEDQDLSQFKILIIPKSHYEKFTTQPGKMPEVDANVIIAAWRYIQRSLFADSDRVGKLPGAKRELRWFMLKHILFAYPKNRAKYQALLNAFDGTILKIPNLITLKNYYQNWKLKCLD